MLVPAQVKAKGARKITYEAFLKALDHVAAKKVCSTQVLVNLQLSLCTAYQGLVLL